VKSVTPRLARKRVCRVVLNRENKEMAVERMSENARRAGFFVSCAPNSIFFAALPCGQPDEADKARVERAPSFLQLSTTKFSGLTATKKPDSRD
jgi:hypothetical protein